MFKESRIERAKMLKAMEYICRHINDEEIFIPWLVYGVADGAIEFGDFSGDFDLDYYLEDADFTDIMDLFLDMMAKARESGGLYCGGVVSNRG